MPLPLVDKSAFDDLVRCWQNAPHPSIKTTSYFPVYVQLFQHLRGRECTFVETGILDGGSLFMWRDWLGPNARVVGIDLNPDARKWEKEGFSIFIGDQGDPAFWRDTLPKIGRIDAFLDDGGHQSFQQIVTVQEVIAHIRNEAVVAVEDSYTSFMNDFASHGEHSFLEYAKDATDCIVGRSFEMYPNRTPNPFNVASVQQFVNVLSINFYNGIVAFQLNPAACVPPQVVRNQNLRGAMDFRHEGKNEAAIEWPDVRKPRTVTVKGAG